MPLGHFRPAFQSRPKGGDGLLTLTQQTQGLTQLEVGQGMVGLALQRLPEMVDCLLVRARQASG